MRHVNLEKFADGALSAQVNKALQKVAENIVDPNTDPNKARKITVTITMKPNPERNFSAAAVETKVALAPELGAIAALSMGKDLNTGEVDCVEIGNTATVKIFKTSRVDGKQRRGYAHIFLNRRNTDEYSRSNSNHSSIDLYRICILHT